MVYRKRDMLFEGSCEGACGKMVIISYVDSHGLV